MSSLVAALRDCFHQAAATCRCPVGRLIRDYGLNDFLTNRIEQSDDAPTLAVKALDYFCEGARPADTRFQVTVFAVAVFLNCHHAKPPRQGIPAQAARDLVAILTQGINEQHIRSWVTANFG
jgi:hypothetical protein